MANSKVLNNGVHLVKPDGSMQLSHEAFGTEGSRTQIKLLVSCSSPHGYFNAGESIGVTAAAATALKAAGLAS